MRYAAARESGAAGLFGDILHVRGAHYAFVVYADVHEELVERDVLLGVGADEVVELHAGDGENGLAVHFGVVEAVQKVDAAGSGGRDARADFAGEFCPGASHEGGRFFVPRLNESDALLILAQRFDDAVHAVARNAEDGVDAPVKHGFDKNLSRFFRHVISPQNQCGGGRGKESVE
ncbi:MAG TPA: hypothetical protein VHW69_06740 [Rhizomicrobium sp.]|nr:hypothetical protein [Rhizomicrobium sp.]